MAPGAATSALDWMRCSRVSARREFDVVAAWSVCRLGRSLSDLIGLLPISTGHSQAKLEGRYKGRVLTVRRQADEGSCG